MRPFLSTEATSEMRLPLGKGQPTSWHRVPRSGEKTGSPSEPNGAASGSRQLGVVSPRGHRGHPRHAVERTLEPSSLPTSQRGLRRGTPRRTGWPKREMALGTDSPVADRSSPTPNPAESAALPLRKTDVRNVVTAPGALRVVDRGAGGQTACTGAAGWSKKPTPSPRTASAATGRSPLDKGGWGNEGDTPTWTTMDGLKSC